MIRARIRLWMLFIGFFSGILVFANAWSAHGMGQSRMMDEEELEMMIKYGYGMESMRPDPLLGGPMMHSPMIGGPMMGMRLDPFIGPLRGLDLSPEQRDKIRGIWRGLRGEHLKDMEKMMNAQDRLFDLMNKDKPDAKKVGEAYISLVNTRKKVANQHLKTRDQILDVLTEEQKKHFKQHTQGAFGKHHEMMH